MEPPQIGARVNLKGSDIRGVVIARHRDRIKVLWSTYSSTWNSPTELIAVESRRLQTGTHRTLICESELDGPIKDGGRSRRPRAVRR
jgi:hypothetical protein